MYDVLLDIIVFATLFVGLMNFLGDERLILFNCFKEWKKKVVRFFKKTKSDFENDHSHWPPTKQA